MKTRKIFTSLPIIILSIVLITSCGEEEKEPQQTTPQSAEETQQDAVKTDTTMEKPAEEMKKEEMAEKPKKEQQKPMSDVPDTYVVEDGETLASIAEKVYGDSQKWFEIFAENEENIDNWNNIYVGQKLKMPTEKDAYDKMNM